MISQAKPLKIKSSLPFNFAITKVCVAMRLAENRTRTGGIKFQLSPSYIRFLVRWIGTTRHSATILSFFNPKENIRITKATKFLILFFLTTMT